MILDINLLLDSNRALTVTGPSAQVYDTAGLGVGVPVTNRFGNTANSGNDIGTGGPTSESPPQLLVKVGTAFAAGGAATMRIQLQAAVDTANNSGTPGTWDTIDQTDDIPVALLVAGAQPAAFVVPERYLGQNFPRFYRLNYVITTGPMTAGTISFAGFLTGIDSNPLYPAAF